MKHTITVVFFKITIILIKKKYKLKKKIWEFYTINNKKIFFPFAIKYWKFYILIVFIHFNSYKYSYKKVKAK